MHLVSLPANLTVGLARAALAGPRSLSVRVMVNASAGCFLSSASSFLSLLWLRLKPLKHSSFSLCCLSWFSKSLLRSRKASNWSEKNIFKYIKHLNKVYKTWSEQNSGSFRLFCDFKPDFVGSITTRWQQWSDWLRTFYPSCLATRPRFSLKWQVHICFLLEDMTLNNRWCYLLYSETQDRVRDDTYCKFGYFLLEYYPILIVQMPFLYWYNIKLILYV